MGVKLEHFVFAADGNFRLQLKVAVASLLVASADSDRNIVIHVLDVGIGNDAWDELVQVWRKLSESANFERHLIDESRFAGYRKWKGGLAAYARILLPELLRDVDYCLYADCDTFFVRGLEALDAYVGGELALYGHCIDRGPFGCDDVVWLKKRGYVLRSENYICSGFMIMNLARFRAESLSQGCLSFLDQNPDSFTADQCAFNVACQGKIGLLPNGWGCFLDEAFRAGFVDCLHFAGSVPWNPPTTWAFYCGDHKFFRLWYQFAEVFCGEHGIEKRYYPPKGAGLARFIARLVYPFLCVIALSGIYPRCFADHAKAIKMRVCNDLVEKVGKIVFRLNDLRHGRAGILRV